MKELLKKYGLRRHNPVGKLMGGRLYFHKIYTDEIEEAPLIKDELDPVYNIIRYNRLTKELCLINCPNFDTENEPTIKFVWNVTKDVLTKYDNNNPMIYHHKWMFVKDDYKGFDVED